VIGLVSACCFCGEAIDRGDDDAVQLAISSLWHGGNPAVQGCHAHAQCFAERLSPSVPFDAEMFSKDG
jgi:hypothetical protein